GRPGAGRPRRAGAAGAEEQRVQPGAGPVAGALVEGPPLQDPRRGAVRAGRAATVLHGALRRGDVARRGGPRGLLGVRGGRRAGGGVCRAGRKRKVSGRLLRAPAVGGRGAGGGFMPHVGNFSLISSSLFTVPCNPWLAVRIRLRAASNFVTHASSSLRGPLGC